MSNKLRLEGLHGHNADNIDGLDEKVSAASGAALMLAGSGIGDDGEMGPPGPPGVAGAPGAAGPAGPAGVTMILAGEDGADAFGIPGPPGPTGAAGADGAIGATGPAGGSAAVMPMGVMHYEVDDEPWQYPPGSSPTGWDFYSRRIAGTPVNTAQGITVSSVVYVLVARAFDLATDTTVFMPSEYRLYMHGSTTIAGQTITVQLVSGSATTVVHTGGNDLLMNNNVEADFDSGWISWNSTATGFFTLAFKGSNGSVNFAYSWIDIMFRRPK